MVILLQNDIYKQLQFFKSQNINKYMNNFISYKTWSSIKTANPNLITSIAAIPMYKQGNCFRGKLLNSENLVSVHSIFPTIQDTLEGNEQE